MRIMKLKKIKSFGLALLILGPALLLARDERITRVQVIMPSSPRADEYEMMTVVARTEDWQVDAGFVGEAWLWTDGPYIRPFHVAFTPQDRGVIVCPAVLNGLGLHRVEAYQLGGLIQTWSNPVLITPPEYPGPRLFWGRLEDCAEPGLDFCLSVNDQTSGTPAGPGRDGPIVFASIKKDFERETWWLVPDPDDPAGPDLINQIKAAHRREELIAVLAGHLDHVLIFSTAGQASAPVPAKPKRKGLIGGRAAARASEKTSLAFPVIPVLAPAGHDPVAWLVAAGPSAIVTVPDPQALLGVWAEGRDPGAIWKALQAGSFYAAGQSRIIIDWSGRGAELMSAEKGKMLIAGQGPREVVNAYQWDGRQMKKVFSRATDDFFLLLDARDARAAGGATSPLFLEVLEPGSPLGGHALAGPITFKE